MVHGWFKHAAGVQPSADMGRMCWQVAEFWTEMDGRRIISSTAASMLSPVTILIPQGALL